MNHTLTMAFRSLRARPSRTGLTIGGIVLGVAVILAISITNLSTMDSLTSVFTSTSGKSNLVVASAAETGEGFSERARGVVLNTPGVQDAIPSIQVTALVVAELSGYVREGNWFGETASQLILYGIDGTLDQKAREYRVVSGRFLSSDPRAYEVVLVEDYAAAQEIEVGEDVDVFVPPDQVVALRVVGLIAKEGAGLTNNGTFGVIPLEAAQEIYSRSGDLDQIDIVAAPEYASETELDGLKAALESRLGASYTVTYPASQGQRVVQMLNVYQIGLSFFSVIAVVVGAFLIYNTFTMTVVERTREIGMLRTVGMTSRQVMQQILTEAGLVGIVGTGLGVGAGALMAPGLIRLSSAMLGQAVPEIHVPVKGLVTSIVVGLGVTILSAAMPALQSSRISPIEALRVRGTQREQWWVRRGWPWGLGMIALALVGFNVRIGAAYQYILSNISVTLLFTGATFVIPATVAAWNRAVGPALRWIYGNEGRIGAGNTERSKQRTTLTVLGLTVSIAMFVSIQSLAASFRHDVQAWMDAFIGGDLYVYSSQPLRSDFGQRIEAVPGVAAVTPMRRVDTKLVKDDGSQDTLGFYAYDAATYQAVTSFVYSDSKADPEQLMDLLGGGDVIFVSTVVADKYNLAPGDAVRLVTRRGLRAFTVGAVVTDFNDRGLVVEGSWKDLRRYFGVNDASAFLVKLQPGATQAEAKQAIDDLYGKRWHLTIESNEAVRAVSSTMLDQTFGMFDVLAALAVLVAALAVINTLTMNVMERTREIGMLRGVGMTRGQVSKMILAEAGSMGVMGGVAGVVLGIFMARLFVGGANVTQGYQLVQILPAQGLALGLAIAMVVSQLAALWPARRAGRLQVIQAIQFE